MATELRIRNLPMLLDSNSKARVTFAYDSKLQNSKSAGGVG
jgi:hypothetical protein